MKLPVFLLAAFAAASASVAFAASDKKPPSASSDTAPATDVGGRVFEFEKRSGAVDEALAVALGRRLPVPDDAAEAGEIQTKIAKARATLRANAKATTTTLISELGKLPKEDVQGHAELFTLMDVVSDEDAAVQYWSAKLTSGAPRPHRKPKAAKKSKTADQPTDPQSVQKSEYRDPEAMIRYLAIAHLYKAALHGNEKAKTAILEAAKSPHHDVKVSAVQYTFALTPQRWKAREELEKRLPPADQYLLRR